MDRRDFMKLATGAGMSLMWGGPRTARAQALAAYSGPLLVQIQCFGGWDPVSFIDPKGGAFNHFSASAIKTAGAFKYSPYMGPQRTVVDPLSGQNDSNDYFDRFFANNVNRMLAIVGMDTGTLDHGAGEAYSWGGMLGKNFPALPALAAAATRPDLAMSYLSGGGYEETGGLIAPTRADSNNGALGSLRMIAAPNAVTPGGGTGTFLDDTTFSNVVLSGMNKRLALLRNQDTVAKRQAQSSVLYTVRTSKSALSDLINNLPQNLDGNGNKLIPQMQIALAAFAAGLSVGASINTDFVFDTHGDHDNNHYPQLDNVFRAVDFLLARAQDLNIADRLTVVVSSDFGRTPTYNGGNGKDHYPISAMLLFGAGVKGGRIVGGTDANVLPVPFNPTTLKPDSSSAGMVIKPEHVHVALRDYLGVAKSPMAAQFDLGVPVLPILQGV